jgi:hypothetical protein
MLNGKSQNKKNKKNKKKINHKTKEEIERVFEYVAQQK